MFAKSICELAAAAAQVARSIDIPNEDQAVDQDLDLIERKDMRENRCVLF